jgi:hypothetical protein
MRNQNKITLCDYLANKVPNDCIQVLEDSGHTFDKPRSKEELAGLLKQYISRDKEKALKNLAEIHPDKELCQSIDRPVMDSDYDGNATMRMMGQDYQNPFFPQYTTNNFRQPHMMNFHGGGHMNACGCGGYSNASGCGGYSNASGCSGNCGCGCKSKSYNNADGGSTSNNLLYLLLGAGFVWFMIKFDNKRKYS